jgi:hypothetical protein
MKYITAKIPDEVMPVAFSFSPYVTHLAAAERLQLKREQMIGAGFYRVGVDGVETAGFSTSLNLGPDRGDAALIQAGFDLTNREYPARPKVRGFAGTVFVEEFGLFPCDDCAPEFGCYRGAEPCRKLPLVRTPAS